MANERLKGYIMEVVNNQLRDNDPKCTKDTFVRLQNEGYTENEAKEMIGAIVVEENTNSVVENNISTSAER